MFLRRLTGKKEEINIIIKIIKIPGKKIFARKAGNPHFFLHLPDPKQPFDIMYKPFLLTGLLISTMAVAQDKMTPELLWQLGRVSGEAISADGKTVIYGVSQINMTENKGEKNLYAIPLAGGTPKQLTQTPGAEGDVAILPGNKIG